MAAVNNTCRLIVLLSFSVIILYTTNIPQTFAIMMAIPPSVFIPVQVCADCGPYGYCTTPAADGNCTICECPEGFGGICCDAVPGPSCNNVSCPTDSGKHFECVDYDLGLYKCECESGWTGSNCDAEIDPCNPNPYPEEDYYCACDWKYTGRWCETKFQDCNWDDCKGCKYDPDDDPPPCNNGTCVYDGYNKKKCRCPDRYSGDKCENFIPNKCDPNPCTHGGVCTEINDGNDFKCNCLDIWTGKDCSIHNVCTDTKCLNGGTCESLPGDEYKCHCSAGWTGATCRVDIDECAPIPCQYNSTCIDKLAAFECICVLGTSGPDCGINFNDCETPGGDPCKKKDGGAVCNDGINSFSCTCSADFTGPDCTMSIIVWNVIKDLDDSIDIIGVLEDIVAKPNIIKDLMPFFLALMMRGDQSVISWDYEDMFLWASYEEIELTKSDFEKKYDSSLGNCFTFNYPNASQSYNLRYSGERYGFQALLRVRQDEYISWIDTAALLVFVHNPKESIFSESVRYQAAPNHETTLIVSQDGFVRLGGKYGTCVEDKSKVESYYYDGDYTVNGCLRSCFQDAVKESCHCMDPRYPMADGETICSLNQRSCVLNVTDVRGDPSNWDDCECPVSCSEKQQIVHWASAGFPSDPVECWKAKAGGPGPYSDCINAFQDIAKVTVYFPSTLQNSFVESPKMTFNQFISYLGGMLGVFIGVSIVSFIEFIFLIHRLFMTLCLNRDATAEKQNDP